MEGVGNKVAQRTVEEAMAFRLVRGAVNLCLATAFAAFALAAKDAGAQTYPDRPVRLIVPFAAGGPTDVTARLIAQGLTENLGKQFYVENIGGAGGNTGTVQAARANADGYTILIISTGFMVNMSLYAKVPYDAKKDFAAVTLAAASPNILTVNPSVPAKTIKELVEVIKANPGKYSYAHPAIGSTPHLSGELFRLHFGLDITQIPFTGAAPAVTSTIGGHTPLAWTALPPAIAAAKDGKLRALAVTSAKRNPALPDVPTMAEAGVQGQEAETLTGVVVPAATPKPVIEFLQREIAKVVAKPDVREKFLSLGFLPVGDTSEEFAKRIDVELEKWGRVIRDAKIPQIQ
jgi:tripartite-type tricarboxylate transporter receptor subunit TctC